MAGAVALPDACHRGCKAHRQPVPVNKSMAVAARSSTRTADGVIRPLLPPTACRWAGTMGQPIRCIGCGDATASAAKNPLQPPALGSAVAAIARRTGSIARGKVAPDETPCAAWRRSHPRLDGPPGAQHHRACRGKKRRNQRPRPFRRFEAYRSGASSRSLNHEPLYGNPVAGTQPRTRAWPSLRQVAGPLAAAWRCRRDRAPGSRP